jgi:hypothetical protein
MEAKYISQNDILCMAKKLIQLDAIKDHGLKFQEVELNDEGAIDVAERVLHFHEVSKMLIQARHPR